MSMYINYISRFIRWILPLVALLLMAPCLVVSPIAFTHAAAPGTHHQVVVVHKTPDAYWPIH